MIDLIERDAVVSLIEDRQKALCPSGRFSRHSVYGSYREKFDAWQEIIDLIQAIPTADPVKHGVWIGEGDGYAGGEIVYDVWCCSECDYCIDDGTDNPKLLPNFCPHCGAKMEHE